MKTTALKIAGVIILTLICAACSFSFLQGGDLSPGSEDALVCTITDIPGGKMYSYSTQAGVLQYYEEHYITAEKVTQLQKYSAAGALQYSYLYQYDAAGNKTLIAYYDSANALGWYQVFTYTGTLVETSAEYDNLNAIQWSRRYVYGTGANIGKIVQAASYDTGSALDGYTEYDYVEYAGAVKPSAQRTYGSVSCDVVKTVSRAAKTAKAVSRALATLTPPTIPATALPGMPDSTAVAALGVTGYTYWYYDSYGESAISLDKDWYPTKVARTDSRVEKPVSMEITWSAGHRISQKKSYYGTTLALDVSLSYDADTGYPTTFRTSGASLLLPLDYEIVYDANNVPARLNVKSDGDLLQWFEYEYTGLALPASVAELRTVDPFAILDKLVETNLKIRHYDGDNKLVETFEFLADGNNVRLNVRDSANAINGYYLASYDSTGRVASLTSHSVDGTQLWKYSYGYADAIKLLDANIPEFGRLVDTYLTDDMAKYAEGFVMDLLF